MKFEEMVAIMDRLREGCPWDRKQTRESLLPYLIEEAFELLEALEVGDPASIREELGDLLLQILFHSRIARERGEFDIHDVVQGLADKMISRHPHVFGDHKYETAEEVVGQWEQRKKEEGKMRESLLDGIPRAMPALLRAQRLQARASNVGFDWDHLDGAWEKLEEEIGELRAAIGGEAGATMMEAHGELGDVLFALVNVSRFIGANPEGSLRASTEKFISRFRYIESKAALMGRTMDEMTLAEMDALWDEAKALEAGRSDA